MQKIIITSAYDQYAIKGFDLNVTDYILKPYSFERFMKAVSRVMELLRTDQDQTTQTETSGSYIFVKTEYRLERLDIDQICYIEGMKDYLRIVLQRQEDYDPAEFFKAGGVAASWKILQSS